MSPYHTRTVPGLSKKAAKTHPLILGGVSCSRFDRFRGAVWQAKRCFVVRSELWVRTHQVERKWAIHGLERQGRPLHQFWGSSVSSDPTEVKVRATTHSLTAARNYGS